MKIRGNKVLIEIESTKTKSGLEVAKETRDPSKLQKGKVVALGYGYQENGVIVPIHDLKEGDTVLYSFWEIVKIEDKEYDMVNESDIKVVL